MVHYTINKTPSKKSLIAIAARITIAPAQQVSSGFRLGTQNTGQLGNCPDGSLCPLRQAKRTMNLNSKTLKMELLQWTGDDGLLIAGPSGIKRSDSEVSAHHSAIYKIYIVIYYLQVPDSDSADSVGSTPNTFAVVSAGPALPHVHAVTPLPTTPVRGVHQSVQVPPSPRPSSHPRLPSGFPVTPIPSTIPRSHPHTLTPPPAVIPPVIEHLDVPMLSVAEEYGDNEANEMDTVEDMRMLLCELIQIHQGYFLRTLDILYHMETFLGGGQE